MKFRPDTTYPYPVLRPGSTDYPDAEFQVEIDLDRIPRTTQVKLAASFALSDSDLGSLIERGDARYGVLVRCSQTRYRKLFATSDKRLNEEIEHGKLFGRVDCQPVVVAVRKVPQFEAGGWHDDYAELQYVDLQPGYLLAMDTAKTYHVDNAEEAPIGSVVDSATSLDLKCGTWSCDLENERIVIQFCEEDHERFQKAKRNSGEWAKLLNGIVLPAVHHAIVEADRDDGEHGEKRWYRCIDQRLKATGCKELGTDGEDRLVDAQRILEHPFRVLFHEEPAT